MRFTIIAATGVTLLASMTSAWTVDFYTSSGCTGDSKSTEGTDATCQQVADLSASLTATFASVGYAGLYTDDDCTTGGEDGGDLDSGTCYSADTEYFGISDSPPPSKMVKMKKL